MPEVDCHTCGETVQKPPHKIERNDRHFCSRECYHEAGRPDMAGENNPTKPAKEKAELTCEVCEDTFEVHPYRADSARFCSRECKDENLRGKTGEDAVGWEDATETFECQNCGDDFEEYPYRNQTLYCSESCYREASKEIFAGDNNPAWRGGRVDNYGPNWDEQRSKALDRDDHSCQQCGVEQSATDTPLHVHHEKRLGWFKEEYDAPEWYKRGNELDNLTTLCRSCHMKEEWSVGAIRES